MKLLSGKTTKGITIGREIKIWNVTPVLLDFINFSLHQLDITVKKSSSDFIYVIGFIHKRTNVIQIG
jgi:hypothetical protein